MSSSSSSRHPPRISSIGAEITPVISIRDDLPRFKALVRDLGEFLADWLSVRYACNIETHTNMSVRKQQLRLKKGVELHELIVEDGDSTFVHMLPNRLGFESQLERRVNAESRRMQREERLKYLKGFCQDYWHFLLQLDHACRSQQFISLFEAVGAEEPEYGYFCCEEIHGIVSIGGFARTLTNDVKEKVSAWLLTCENSIAELYKLNETGSVKPETLQERTKSAAVRDFLGTIISRHLSMEGMYEWADGRFVRNQSAFTPKAMEQLCREILDSPTRAKCELMRRSQIAELSMLGKLCSNSDPVEKARFVCENGDALLKTLRNLPRVLRERPGFKHARIFVEMIIGIVRVSNMDCLLLIAAHIKEWTHRVGRAQMYQLSQWIEDSIQIMKRQDLPDSMLQTLWKVCPPLPPWGDHELATTAYMGMKNETLPKSCNIVDRAYLPIPNSVERSLRLVSLVWELAGHPSTYKGFFSQGNLSCSLVEQVIYVEQVNVGHAGLVIEAEYAKCTIGQNYRNAVAKVQNFRGSSIENDVRVASSKLARWRLDEIMTIAYENGPLFESYECEIINATASAMKRVPTMHWAGIIRKALENACPILHGIRFDMRVCPCSTSDSFMELLMTLPAIRAWDGKSQELILSQEDASRGARGLPEQLKELSAQRRLVHLGRRPASEKSQWKHMRVYTFNGPDLRAILRRET